MSRVAYPVYLGGSRTPHGAGKGGPGKGAEKGSEGGASKEGGKDGKKGKRGLILGGWEPKDVLGVFALSKQKQAETLWEQIPGGWRATIRVSGIFVEGIGAAGPRGEAEELAIWDYVQKLALQGIMPRMPSKKQVEKGGEAAKLPTGPSWAIQGAGPSNIVLPPEKKQKIIGKGKGKKGEDEKETSNLRNIENEYSKILQHVRAGDVASALGVVTEHLSVDRGVMKVSQLATIVSNVGVRSDQHISNTLLKTIDDMELVDFKHVAARSYFCRFARWALREFLAEGEASISQTATVQASTLERNGKCIPQLQCFKNPKYAGEFHLTSSGALSQNHNFMRGDWLFLTFPHTCRVGISDGSSGTLPATLEAELCGLLPIGQHGVNVRIVGVQQRMLRQLEGKYCRVDKAANHVTFDRQVEALRLICTEAGELGWLRQILLNADDPVGTGREPALCCNYHGGPSCPKRYDLFALANESQYEALKAGTSQRLSLIQGPPGSGKTSTALLLVRLWLAAKRGPILVSADSNVAVDNLVAGCVKAGLDVIRIGRPEATRSDLDAYNLIEKAKAAGGGSGERDNWTVERKLIGGCEVVACTCSGAAHPVMKGCKFNCALIDEAAQATELAQIVPLLLLTGTGSAALVGDHKQLPPTVACLEADVEGLGTSLFQRLAALGVPPILLDVQYRMHPAIATFPSQEFYGGKLRTGVTGAMRPPPAGIVWPVACAPVCFLPIQSMESKDGVSFTNETEASVVDQILTAVITCGDIAPKDIGVITPYASQARLLKRRFGCPPPGRRRPGQEQVPLVGHAAIEVSSVDGYQGREKELIIVSTVRANPLGKVGFLSDPRRLNVMLTRAKRGLIVVGNFDTLARDDHGWRPFLVWAQQRGFVAGCPPTNLAAAAEIEKLCELKGDDLLAWQPQVDDSVNDEDVKMEQRE